MDEFLNKSLEEFHKGGISIGIIEGNFGKFLINFLEDFLIETLEKFVKVLLECLKESLKKITKFTPEKWF